METEDQIEQTEEMEQEEVKEEEKFFGSLELLQITKNSQSQNGLKHGDFHRYRRYCTKKIKRIRKQMGFRFGKGKHFDKNLLIEKEKYNDPKLLQVILYQAEHAWAYGMDLKQNLINQGEKKANRSKFSIRRKFKRAMFHSAKLSQICQKRTDQKSAKESTGYSYYLAGLMYHEFNSYPSALENYIKSREIYNDLMSVSDTLQSVLYRDKIENLDQNIRFCYQKSGGSMFDTVETILKEYQSNKHVFDNLVTETENQRFIEVEYHGEKYPIKNDRLISCFNNLQQLDQKLKGLTSIKPQTLEQELQHNEEILGVYIDMFSQFDDALKHIQKDKDEPTNSEAEKNIYNERLQDRNELLIKFAISKFDREDGINNLEILTTKKAYKQKLTRPTEIAKLCENLGQVFKSVMEIQRLNPNLATFRKIDAVDLLYRGIRCFFICCVYSANNRMLETLSLLNHCQNYFQNSQKRLQDLKDDSVSEYFGEIDKFNQRMSYLRVKTKIYYFQNQIQDEEKIEQKITEIDMDGGKTQNQTLAKLISIGGNVQLEKFDTIKIDEIPPKPQLMACKPIFFDMAYSYIKYPKLQKSVQESKKSGGGFWGKLNPFKK